MYERKKRSDAARDTGNRIKGGTEKTDCQERRVKDGQYVKYPNDILTDSLTIESA